jgi:very-short-patch-repair endonuclease
MISDDQLLALGWTRKEIQGQVRRGSLHLEYRGVYSVGHRRVVAHARLLAALLSCGDSSFLSHRTAAAVWGLRAVNTRRIEVTVPGRRLGPRAAIVIHQSARPDPTDVAKHNGLRVSSVPRMLVEQSDTERQAELERLITEAVRKHVLNFKALEDMLNRHARRPGIANLKRALRDYRPRADRKSGLERAFDELISGTDVPPPERNVYINGWEIDCYWAEFSLAVELDGRDYHSSLQDMERDRRKDADLIKLGIWPLRITDLRFELEPDRVFADLHELTRPERRREPGPAAT